MVFNVSVAFNFVQKFGKITNLSIFDIYTLKNFATFNGNRLILHNDFIKTCGI